MIIDDSSNLHRYLALNRRFSKVLAYLDGAPAAALPEGVAEIDGRDVYITVMERDLRAPADAPLEAHDAYIDIQIVIEGEETYGWSPRKSCVSPRGAMDAGADIIFFDDAPQQWFTLRQGQMAVFFSDDAHAPLAGSGRVRKAVVKVKG